MVALRDMPYIFDAKVSVGALVAATEMELGVTLDVVDYCTLKAGATGFQSSSLVSSNENPDQITAIVRFDTTANYEKNSARPEIGAWFERLRADLIADPEWFNGTVARDNVS